MCASVGWLSVLALSSVALPGWETTVVSSSSMEPALRRGDAVLVRRTPFDRVVPGDVVVFDTGAGSVVHRVVRVEDGRLVTQGDANASPDSDGVDESALDGVGRILVPSIGLPRLWWSEGRIDLLLVGVVSLTVAARASRSVGDPWATADGAGATRGGRSQADWLFGYDPLEHRPLFPRDVDRALSAGRGDPA